MREVERTGAAGEFNVMRTTTGPRSRGSHRNASAMKMVGALLAVFRTAAGHTQRSLGDVSTLGEQTIASIEQGRRRLMPDVAREFDELLDTKGALGEAVRHMPEVDLVPLWAEEFLEREREAIAISSYENQVLPGLLQTDAYAEAVFRSRVPVYDEDEIAGLVAGRVKRRELLHGKGAPMTGFVIWEPVVRAPIGGREVWIEQLRHLRACSQLPGLMLQILPLNRTSHASFDGPFVLLETPEHQRLAYTETHRGSQLIADQDEVAILTQKCAMLRSQALTPEDTRDLLDRLLGEQ